MEQGRSQSLTRLQAQKLREEYQYLKGNQLSLDNDEYVVECVAVAPYDDINKWVFLHYYQDYRDAQKALNFYLVPFFDVILILSPSDKASALTYLNLHAYLEKKNTLVSR